jgi:hypothetical protein
MNSGSSGVREASSRRARMICSQNLLHLREVNRAQVTFIVECKGTHLASSRRSRLTATDSVIESQGKAMPGEKVETLNQPLATTLDISYF